MTQFSYSHVKDKELIEKSINYNAWLLFGKNNKNQINNFFKLFQQKVSTISVLPHGSRTQHINPRVPGICRRIDENTGALAIEMLGYKNAPASQQDFLLHEGPHEFCHAFADLAPLIYSKYTNGRTKDGVKYFNEMGMISEKDAKTGQPVGQHFYGKMFNETMMDIFTTMGLAAFDSDFQNKNRGTTVDSVMKTNYKSWGDATTGYSIFTSITRLAIAAFSNNGDINYQDLSNKGYGIININTEGANHQKLKANDFIYGIMCDPQHIEDEFDKVMGDGYYRVFTEYLDRLFISFQRTGQVPPQEVKRIMNILPDFLNKKCAYNLRNGIFTQNTSQKIIGDFNRIWNSMQKEYGAYFSQSDINEIGKRAGFNVGDTGEGR